MEIAGIVVQLVECMSPSIGRRWKNHRDIHKNMDTLKQRLEELNCRKSDVESKLATDLVQGETELGNEVKSWLERVEKITNEVHGIELKEGAVKFFSRASLGKIVIQKIAEVEELYSKAQFPDGLVLQLPQSGQVIPTTATLGGETTFKRKMEEIWECLLDDEVMKIGVHGMGGIGKTTALEHIHNRLLKDGKGRFDHVIWVTVSKDTDISNLQDKIASKLVGSDIFGNDHDIKTRSAKLHAKLITRGRCVLMLDDLWQPYALEEVGIPEPTTQNRSKLVVTTRSHDICRVMSCKPIAIELLSEDEALKLFLDVVGHDVLSVPNLEATIKEVVRECDGLALAITTTAGSLKDIVDVDEWESALEELREVTKDSASCGTIERLKFSYDRLSDTKLQECLLYCALYPEDYPIKKSRLVELLVAEGIIDEKRRKLEISKGKRMLNRLVNASLLNETINFNGDECVKMHDLIRDMALQVTSESPRFLVKAGVGLKSLPDEENWKDDLVKVSLMKSEISDIPSSYEPPNCPRLSTLFLSQSYFESMPDNFFLHMKGLNLLDLSNSHIHYLPDSLSDLVNLVALILRSCFELKDVPSLAKLKNLRMLDLHYTSIEEIPQGMENLVKLRYLDLSFTLIKMIPEEILWKLDNLQYLSLLDLISIRVRVENLEMLTKLEHFEGILYDNNHFNAYVRSFEQQRPTNYILKLTNDFSYGHIRSPMKANYKIVLLERYNVYESVAAAGPLLLPKDIETLSVRSCNGISNLCELISLENVTSLKNCTIEYCKNIMHLFQYSSHMCAFIQSLEDLNLFFLRNLCRLISKERGALSTSSLLPVTFSSLKRLRMNSCHKIKKLFFIASVPNLEVLHLENCLELMEISATSNDDEDPCKEGEESVVNTLTLSKLTTLELLNLPELQSVAVIADSLQRVRVTSCPKLKSLPFLDKEPFPGCQDVFIDKSTWDSLEWDHPNAKDITKSLCTEEKDDFKMIRAFIAEKRSKALSRFELPQH